MPTDEVSNMRYNTLHAHNMPLPTQLKDLEDFGMDKVIEMALEAAWDGCDAVYMSCESISSKPSRPCIIVNSNVAVRDTFIAPWFRQCTFTHWTGRSYDNRLLSLFSISYRLQVS